MHKNTFLVIISIVVLGIAVFLGAYMLRGEKQSFISNITPTPPVLEETDSNTTPIPPVPKISYSLAGIDYTSLEKDRLYTEEEGKYANLNETGKKLLRAIIIPRTCPDESTGYCSSERLLAYSFIITVNDGYTLLKFPNSKGGYYYEIYDLTQKEFVKNEVNSFGATIRTDKIFILIGIKELWKYKVGERFVTRIKNSEIHKDETYFKSAGLDYAEFESTISDSSLTLSVFPNDNMGAEKLREITINLNNL